MFSFRLSDAFVDSYATREVPWGFTDAGGNSIGEITFLRTYSRLKEDGTKERWHEVCARVINGMFSIQKDYCRANRLPWNDHKAARSAQDAYERMFCFKWTPPGRGLWMMGSPLVNRDHNSAALMNCAFVSTGDMTKTGPVEPFAFLMEASMLGVGVGFDSKGAEKEFLIQAPNQSKAWTYLVPDTREGWVQAMVHKLESYLIPGKGVVSIDTREVRPAGSRIRTFGGTAAGPEPLDRLIRKLDELLDHRAGELLTTVDIADIGNLIGVCVVSGNVRRSAELFQGDLDDKQFINLKNPDIYPERNAYDPDPDRNGWGWMSNNSVVAQAGADYGGVVDAIARNGEPGIIWLDTTRRYGRLIDPPNNKDWRVAGFNPCAEQSLESFEMCTLVETYIGRHDSLEDYQKTLKYAYLYAKTVTLMPTHWPRSNAIMARNRRIGTSIAGVADFADNHGMTTLRTWMNEGYATVQYYDNLYSEWLGIRPSIKTTTIKPGGTTPLLAGESPGAHWGPGGEYCTRSIRFSKDDPMVTLFRWANYHVEIDQANPDTTVVVYFPVHSKAKRSAKQVSLFEKANLAVVAQRYWSDNSVSVTLTFDPETEGQHVGTVLHMHEGQLKTVSFLPSGNKVYPQMPYIEISREDYEAAGEELFKVDLSPIYAGGALDAAGEAYCTTDRCELPQPVSA